MQGRKKEEEDEKGGLMYQQLRKFINVIVGAIFQQTPNYNKHPKPKFKQSFWKLERVLNKQQKSCLKLRAKYLLLGMIIDTIF